MKNFIKQKLAIKNKLYKVVKNEKLEDIIFKYEINEIKKYITTPFDKVLIGTLYNSSWWQDTKQKKYRIEDDTPIKSINIGVEWEFWGNPTPAQIKKYSLYKEYYDNMWETSFYKENIPLNIKSINDFLEEVKLKMLQIKKEVDDCKISTHPIKIDTTGLVFNGVHIHLSVNTEKYHHSISRTESIFYNIKEASLILDKLKKLPSYRCINSHHLWGRYKDWNYNYKQKPKFKFVNLTPYSTIELRAVDTEDLIYRSRRLKISQIIFNIINKKYNTPVRLPALGNGDNLKDVAKLCRQFLNTTTQKVVVDEPNFMRIKSNYRYINMYLDENRIEVE